MAILQIHNFGPVHDATIEINRLNIFIGEQSVGKSTIAKLITIFTDYINLAFLCSNKDQKTAWETLVDEFDLTACTIPGDYDITYEEQTEDLNIQINIFKGNVQTKVIHKGKVLTNPRLIIALVIMQKPIYHSDSLFPKDMEVTSETLGKIVAESFRNSLYIPAERIIASLANKLLSAMMLVKEQMPKNLLHFITELFNAKAKYPELPIGLLDVRYKVVSGEDYVILKDTKQIPIQNASSGMQSVIPLILVMKYGKEQKQYGSFVVEEPECNLFPDKQVQLLQMLIRDIYNDGRRLTITTHSPYLLSALNNCLYADKLVNELSEDESCALDAIVASDSRVRILDCSIYSLGEDINDGVYCKKITDPESGLIDYNYLDGVSMQMSEEFSKMQSVKVRSQRKSHKPNKSC